MNGYSIEVFVWEECNSEPSRNYNRASSARISVLIDVTILELIPVVSSDSKSTRAAKSIVSITEQCESGVLVAIVVGGSDLRNFIIPSSNIAHIEGSNDFEGFVPVASTTNMIAEESSHIFSKLER